MNKLPKHLQTYLSRFKPYETVIRRLLAVKKIAPSKSLALNIVLLSENYSESEMENVEQTDLLKMADDFTYKLSSYVVALEKTKGADFALSPDVVALISDFLKPNSNPKPSGSMDMTTILLIVAAIIGAAIIIK